MNPNDVTLTPRSPATSALKFSSFLGKGENNYQMAVVTLPDVVT